MLYLSSIFSNRWVENYPEHSATGGDKTVKNIQQDAEKKLSKYSATGRNKTIKDIHQ
jgi:hypothetical protein